MWSKTTHRAAKPRIASSHAGRRPFGAAGTDGSGDVGSVTRRAGALVTLSDVTRTHALPVGTWRRRVLRHITAGFAVTGSRSWPGRRAAATPGPFGLGRGVGPLQRGLGGGQVALGQHHEHAVDHRELGDPAGHGAGPERGLAGRGE